MIIAELKRKENIVEYIIYIRQLVDIIRANNFDINKIDEILVSKYDVSEKNKIKIHNWYQDLIQKIKDAKAEKSGDIQEITDIIEFLNHIHEALLNDENEYRHKELYRWAQPNIEEYRKISKCENDNDVKVCIDAMNALLLLKLSKKEVSEETSQAMQTFGALLANIADTFKGIENMYNEKK